MLAILHTVIWTDQPPNPTLVTPWPQLYAVQSQPGGSLLLLLYTALQARIRASVAVSESRAIYPQLEAGRMVADACESALEPMDISEVDDVPFIFEGLREGEVIQSFEVQVQRDAGNPDANPQALAVGLYAIGEIEDGRFYLNAEGHVVLQRFGARERGTIYGIRGIARLTSGRRIVASATLGVTRKGAIPCYC